MRVIPCKKQPAAGDAASNHECVGDSDNPEPSGFWHRLAAGIDLLGAYPVRHALSDRDVDQVDAEIERCRLLMSGQQPRRNAAVIPLRVTSHHVLVPIKVRS